MKISNFQDIRVCTNQDISIAVEIDGREDKKKPSLAVEVDGREDLHGGELPLQLPHQHDSLEFAEPVFADLDVHFLRFVPQDVGERLGDLCRPVEDP